LRVDVQVQALITIRAIPVPDEEIALRHLAQVVLVQELARLALLAEPAQPMLAYQRPVSATVRLAGRVLRRIGGDVSLGTARFEGAVARGVGFADGSVCREGVLVVALEEGREGECVVRVAVRQHFLRRGGSSRGCHLVGGCCGSGWRW